LAAQLKMALAEAKAWFAVIGASLNRSIIARRSARTMALAFSLPSDGST